MSGYQGSGGLGPNGGAPPHGLKSSSGGRNRPNKYRNLKPSEQKNTSGQRRAARKETR